MAKGEIRDCGHANPVNGALCRSHIKAPWERCYSHFIKDAEAFSATLNQSSRVDLSTLSMFELYGWALYQQRASAE
jgi:hypothetical protein